MTENLYSTSWYRVAQLRPRLRGHARWHRHRYRAQLWYVLHDRAAGRCHRFTPAAWHVLARMDGSRTLHEIWEEVTPVLGDAAPTQDETIRLLGQLHAADLLLCDVPPDALELFARQRSTRRTDWQRRLASPLAVRIPLLDPDRLLVACVAALRPLLHRAALVVWAAVVGAAAWLAAAHWAELSADLAARALAPRNLMVLALMYPLVKALHELGHGIATRAWGGEVHEAGVMLLVLMPMPYVDASAAAAFPDKRRRMLVGAAGIGVELFLAALALFVWLNVEPGWVRTAAWNVMLIGGVSTLLFNGNPLLRYDGYYVLADALEIPNLASRASQHLTSLAERYLLGLEDARWPATAPGEARWFVLYGLAALGYRVFIVLAIALFVADLVPVAGALFAAWAIAAQLVWPVLKGVHFLFTHERLRRTRARALAVTGGLATLLAAFALLWPLPLRTRAEGVVWLPEHSQVRAGTDGFVARLLATPGTRVLAGQPLLELSDPLLTARLEVLEARRRELEARRAALWGRDRVAAQIVNQELATVEADLALANERVRERILRSPAEGAFVVPQARDLPGRFLHQGELAGYVADLPARTVRVAVSQADIGLIREGVRAVEVRLAERLDRPLPARVERAVPAATRKLPSRALGEAGGGRLAVDPLDPEGRRAIEKFFLFDVALAAPAGAGQIGGRAYVRFDHGTEPLAQQSLRRLRRLLLRRFGA